MKFRRIAKSARGHCKPYRVTHGDGFRLKDFDPQDTGTLQSKEEAGEFLANGIELLSHLQEKLYAQDRWAVLMIFQALDAAGKDGAIKHVMSGVNPQGCEVSAFKAPSDTELNHDYLWRTNLRIPERGRIGIFNRSYYEETLVVRVHPELLQRGKIPEKLITKEIWKQRYQDINAFERYLSRNGILVLKFFLHVSKKEQKRRFLERLEDPKKNWKFSMADVKERGFWKQYQQAYEEMIQNTATQNAPWYVVPADNKWFTRIVVGGAIIDALWQLDLSFPEVDKARRNELAAVRESLLRGKD